MRVFRLSKRQFAEPLSGIGAAMFGGRWNSKGVEIIYTANSRALAMAEVAVHITLATLPPNYVMIELDIPHDIEQVKLSSLPLGWQAFPIHPPSQRIGDDFVRNNKSLSLEVPSAVVQGDFNLLINPHHANFSKVKIIEIVDFPFDKRILKP